MTVSAQDDVGVFDSSFNQLFPGARPIRAIIKETSDIMKHPIETGATISDHVVIQPTEIELSLILDPETFQDTYQSAKAAWKALELLSVQTKADTYTNMLIYDMPHDETPDMFDTIPLAIKLREADLVDAQYAQLPKSKVRKTSNSSTVKTGQKTAAPTQPQSSAAYDLIFGSK